MSRRELVGQMIRHIRSIALEPEEVRDLYDAITGRMTWRRCSVCLKTKLEIEGKMVLRMVIYLSLNSLSVRIANDMQDYEMDS
jgi:hypothetical protein